MFDGRLRLLIHPGLDAIARVLVARGISADWVTLTGFGLALVAAGLIAGEQFLAGLMVLGVSRLCDGLDGAVAKLTRPTDFGGYLDIVLDFAFYGLVPLAFALADPGANALAASVLLLSFYVNGASFLAMATIAEKRGLSTDRRGSKSFYFATGLAEAAETFAVFALFCLFPAWFVLLAYGFAAICFLTAALRILEARALFGGR